MQHPIMDIMELTSKLPGNLPLRIGYIYNLSQSCLEYFSTILMY